MRRIRPVGEFITCKTRKVLLWVESTRLFQGTARQIRLVRENITVRLGDISVRAALNRLCRRGEDNENTVTQENVYSSS